MGVEGAGKDPRPFKISVGNGGVGFTIRMTGKGAYRLLLCGEKGRIPRCRFSVPRRRNIKRMHFLSIRNLGTSQCRCGFLVSKGMYISPCMGRLTKGRGFNMRQGLRRRRVHKGVISVRSCS